MYSSSVSGLSLTDGKPANLFSLYPSRKIEYSYFIATHNIANITTDFVSGTTGIIQTRSGSDSELLKFPDAELSS